MPLTQRIELRVDDQFVDDLTDLATRLHKSRADVIRDALNYYNNAVEEWERDNGRAFGVDDALLIRDALNQLYPPAP